MNNKKIVMIKIKNNNKKKKKLRRNRGIERKREEFLKFLPDFLNKRENEIRNRIRKHY